MLEHELMTEEGSASSAGGWTTITLEFGNPQLRDPALRIISDRVEALAARTAELEGVSGVETRDPFLPNVDLEFEVASLPQLIAYCEPAHAAAVRSQLESWIEVTSFEVTWHQADHALEGGDDWRDRWKRFYAPMVFRDRFLVRPSWIERAPQHPTCELVLDPGRAFGTGLHASTRLCLEHILDLAEQSRTRSSRTLIDLGCGSGILGLSAAKVLPDAEFPRFTDIDPDAIEVARENAGINGVAASFEVGTAQTIEGKYDLVLANIRPRVLLPDATAIRALMGPGSQLVLSGILDEELDEILRRYTSLDLELVTTHAREGWSSPRMRTR